MFVWDFLFLFLISISLFFFFFFRKFYLTFYKAGKSRTQSSCSELDKVQSVSGAGFFSWSLLYYSPTAFGKHLKSSTACELGPLGPSPHQHSSPRCSDAQSWIPELWFLPLFLVYFILNITNWFTSRPNDNSSGPALCVREHWRGVCTLPLPGAGLDLTFLAFMFLVYFLYFT